jgi:hypothetical protein
VDRLHCQLWIACAAFGASGVNVIGGGMLDFWCYSSKDSGGKIVGVKSGKARICRMDMAGFNGSQLLSPEFGLAEFPVDDYNVYNSMTPSLLKHEGHRHFLYFHSEVISK